MKPFSKFFTVLLTACMLFAAASPVFGANVNSQKSEEPAKKEESFLKYSQEEMLSHLGGVWKGSFHTRTAPGKYAEDEAQMSFIASSGNPRLFLVIDSYEANYLTPAWRIEDSELVFSFNDSYWSAMATLHFSDENTLTGTYAQYGEEFELQFEKLSSKPTDYSSQPQFIFEDEEYSVWRERLTKYPDFDPGSEKDFGTIPFTYELWRWDKSFPLVRDYGMADAIRGKSDVEQMIALLNLVCDNFRHDGSYGIPEGEDAAGLSAQTVINLCRQNGGIECRGLSIILSEMLRTSGIPAKPIMCIPSTDPCEECHVVVHAYSESLGQWIMLDPTYRLVLKDETGRYVDLPTLRRSLVSGAKLVANSNAGHNRMPFYMDFYRAYMTKNTFRFSCLTDFSYGSEGSENNQAQMLVPKGYPVPYAGSRPERVTTNAAAFWAPPQN